MSTEAAPKPTYWLQSGESCVTGPFTKTEARQIVEDNPAQVFTVRREGEETWQDPAVRLAPKRDRRMGVALSVAVTGLSALVAGMIDGPQTALFVAIVAGLLSSMFAAVAFAGPPVLQPYIQAPPYLQPPPEVPSGWMLHVEGRAPDGPFTRSELRAIFKQIDPRDCQVARVGEPLTNAKGWLIDDAVSRVKAGAPTGKDRGVYIVLGLLLGFFGAHNFYAERIGEGIAQMLLFLVVLAFSLAAAEMALIAGVALFLWVMADVVSVEP